MINATLETLEEADAVCRGRGNLMASSSYHCQHRPTALPPLGILALPLTGEKKRELMSTSHRYVVRSNNFQEFFPKGKKTKYRAAVEALAD